MNDSLNEKEIQKKVRREAFKRNWLLFRQSTLGMIGLGIVFFFFILAILQPILFLTGAWNEAVYHPVVGYEEIKVNLLVVECPDEYPTEKYESSNDCPGDGEITQRQIYNPNINPALIVLDETKVAKELEKLETDYSSKKYQQDRAVAYPPIGDQLDDLYKKGAFSDEMAAKIKKVKDDNPKS